jgi:outer membrane immunogenic protein
MDKVSESVRLMPNLQKLSVEGLPFLRGASASRQQEVSASSESLESSKPKDTEMTKRFMVLAVSGAAVLMASPALADGYKAKAAPVACCEANWNGIYFGGGIGWAAMIAGQTDSFGPTAPVGTVNEHEFGSDGVFGFLRVGLDRQIHPGIVLGAFADFEFHDVGAFGKLSSQRQATKLFTAGTDVFRRDVDLDTAWAVGARLGFVRSCCTMWYINGGYTEADINFKFTQNGVTVPGTRSDVTVSGWFIGGGVEQQLARGFALSLEYRLANYDSKDVFNGQYLVGGVNSFHREELDPTIHTVRLGLTYKFDVHSRPQMEPLK